MWIGQAIGKGKKVSFQYLAYGTDKKQYPKLRSDGSDRYVVSPYQMAAKEGKYYLICNFDKYDDISNYRLDRIRDIHVLDEPAKPFGSLQWSNGQTLDLAEYMKKHVYMYSSGDRRVKLKIVKAMVSDIIDLFGKEVVFSDETETHVSVSAYANEMSVEQFAKSYAPDVIVLEPQDMRERMKTWLEKASAAYQGNG